MAHSNQTKTCILLPAILLLTSCLEQTRNTPTKAMNSTDTIRPYLALSPPLHYEVFGADHPSNAPMLMIHGFGENTYTWRHVVPQLATERQLLLVDLKGFGRSPKPIDTNYSPIDQADLL